MENIIELKGDTTEKKFLHIQHILNKFRRKLGNKVVGLIPPIPIYDTVKFPDENGIVFRVLVPLKCVIHSAHLFLGRFEKDVTKITVNTFNGNISHAASKICKEHFEKFELEWTQDTCTIVEMSILPIDTVEDILTCIIVRPEMVEYMKEKYVLDTILALEENGA